MNEGSGGFFKLGYYRVLFPVAILATVLGWGLEIFVERGASRFDTVLLLGTATWLTAMGALLAWWPNARRTLEIVLCVGVAGFFLTRMTHAIYLPDTNAPLGNELVEFAFWLAPFFGLQFLWFGIAVGRSVAVVSLTGLALVPVPALLMGDLPVGGMYGLSMLILAGAATIFVYHVLGTTLIRFGTEKREIEQLAVTDHLTGIANRRGLYMFLSEELARTQRYGGRVSVFMLDLDRFKEVNDAYGHQVGDRVLQEVAGILRAESREVDTVGRWGGEEFLAILPQVDAGEAAAVARRIRRAVQEHAFEDGVTSTVSIGVAECRAGDSMEEIVGRADAALYQAKIAGRNRVETAD